MILPENFDFTQGNLQDYLDCPYRFYLRHILHTKWPALVVDDALDFELRGQAGGRFHRLIQQYLLGIPEDRISELVAEDPNPDLTAWWEAFLANVPSWLKGQRWVETTLTTHLAGHRLVAKYDLIMVEDHAGLTIFDWKTAQKLPRKDWLLARVQTRLYRLALTDAGSTFTGGDPVEPEQIKMNYWFAAHPQSPVSLPYSHSDYQRDHADLTHLIEDISTSEPASFQRTHDLKQCRFCVYRSHCDRGVQAGDLAAFDDFDMEPEDIEAEMVFTDIPEIEF